MSAPAHAAHHAPQGFIRKWVFSLDHKVIGIQYAVTGLAFLLLRRPDTATHSTPAA